MLVSVRHHYPQREKETANFRALDIRDYAASMLWRDTPFYQVAFVAQSRVAPDYFQSLNALCLLHNKEQPHQSYIRIFRSQVTDAKQRAAIHIHEKPTHSVWNHTGATFAQSTQGCKGREQVKGKRCIRQHQEGPTY